MANVINRILTEQDWQKLQLSDFSRIVNDNRRWFNLRNRLNYSGSVVLCPLYETENWFLIHWPFIQKRLTMNKQHHCRGFANSHSSSNLSIFLHIQYCYFIVQRIITRHLLSDGLICSKKLSARYATHVIKFDKNNFMLLHECCKVLMSECFCVLILYFYFCQVSVLVLIDFSCELTPCLLFVK
jgi:hypothetical protein